jgi:hypothetical protein
VPFPELHDLKSMETTESYTKFLKERLESSVEFPFIESCYKNGTVTFPKEKS